MACQGLGYRRLLGGAVAAASGRCCIKSDPRDWYQVGSRPRGVKYFEPSLARTSNGKFISAEAGDA